MDMKKWFKKQHNQEGAVTIEATIALTSFLFMFIMIYSIITICRTQAIIQVAINSTAKELSQYSYLYSITGLHDSMTNLQNSAQSTKDNANSLASDVADVFSGIQSIGGKAGNINNVQGIMDSWDEIAAELESTGGSLTSAQEKITAMAEDPKALLFGMAKLFVSEGYEMAKSAASEAISRVLTQKHLKRSEKDTAEAFCQSVGIVPGTYFGKESSFNGIDFSHSTLFPYGSDEITIVANYKMKLLQLLPISFEFHFTQTAVTKGWLQGDGTASGSTPQQKLEKIQSTRGDSVWNAATGSEREKLIRSMGIDQLKSEGYYGVSGQTYIHAYDPATNTFVMIRSYNPLASVDSVADVDREAIKKYLENLQGQMVSNTDNMHTIKIKKTDENGNLVTSEINCSGESTKKVIVVIPEDPGLKEIFEQIVAEMGSKVDFEFQSSYGEVFTDTSEGTSTEGED